MKVSENCRVKINYSIALDSGEVVDQTPPGETLEFETGKGQVIPALEKMVLGMESGQKKSFETEPDEAFGPRDPEAVRRVNRDELSDRGAELEEGMMFRVRDEEDNAMVITVLEAGEEDVVLDLNHPLAGASLLINVEVVEVSEI